MTNQVKENHSAIPVLEDEAIHYDFLLVEPQDDHVSVDAFLCMHRNSSEKCVQSDDVPRKLGESNYGPGQEQNLIKARDVPDIKPSQTEAGKFHSPNRLSSFCEDYLLDGEVEECSIELDHKSGTVLQKSVSKNHTLADSPGDNGASQKSGSSGTTDQVDGILGGLDVDNSEPDGIFSCTGDSDKSLENCWFKYPSSFTIENIEEDVSSMFSNGNDQLMGLKSSFTSGQVPCIYISNQENRDSLVPCQRVVKESALQNDASPTKRPVQALSINNHDEKRQRKPPKRFIDELSGPKSKSSLKKDSSAPCSKGKLSGGGASKHHTKKPKAESFSPEDPVGFAIQVPFGPLVQNESDTNQDPPVAKTKTESRYMLPSSPNMKVSKSDKEVSMSDTETDTETESEEGNVELAKYEESVAGRRKHHVLWTVSEVKLLIDGVSQYGVGRWSRIKKDLFPSSVHRTPVDLKDKWRNLLKASRVLKDKKSGEEGKRNLAWRPLPKSILRRVNELSSIHPYPRDLRAKG